jgi:DNA-binding response OmpR family regulator
MQSMQKDGQNSRVVRFGAFEADLLTRELRKRGVRVRLQEQPFRLLQALLERPGQIGSREEIKEKLWPDDTLVDFDKSLNTAAQKLRQALGDSAEPSAVHC